MNKSCNIKIKYVTEDSLSVGSSSMKDYACHYGVSTQKPNGYLNFAKNNENVEFFTLKRVFKNKDFVSKQRVSTNDLGKM